MRKSIPNTITSLNILSGCLSIVFAFEGNLILASYFILFSAVLDFLDGMAARMLNAYTQIGKQLDSLADVVSFGLAPSVVIYQLLKFTLQTEGLLFRFEYPQVYEIMILMSSFVITIFAALRLARYNVDKRQTDSFIGLPVPANAIFIAGLPLILFETDFFAIKEIIMSIWFLVGYAFLGAFLMVSELHMFSLKFKSLLFKDNIVRYLFLLICVILVIVTGYLSLPLMVIVYLLLSMVISVFSLGNSGY